MHHNSVVMEEEQSSWVLPEDSDTWLLLKASEIINEDSTSPEFLLFQPIGILRNIFSILTPPVKKMEHLFHFPKVLKHLIQIRYEPNKASGGSFVCEESEHLSL